MRASLGLSAFVCVGLAACALDRAPLSDRGPGSDGGLDAGADAAATDAAASDAAASDAGQDAGPGERDAGRDAACSETAAPVDRVLGAAELEDPAAQQVAVALDAARLVLRVQPYRLGALLAQSHVNPVLMATPSGALDLDAALARAPTGEQVFVETTDLTVGAPPLRELGIPDDGHGVVVRGEIFLDAGTTAVRLFFDDVGMMRVTIDGVNLDTRADWPTPVTTTIEAPRADWYPIAFAWNESVGASVGQLLFDPPGPAGLAAAPASRLRVRRGLASGREMLGWNGSTPTGYPAGARLDTGPSTADWARSFPVRVGIAAADRFAVRWVGRARLGTDDAVFRYATDDGQRLFVDGVFLGGDLTGASATGLFATALCDGTYDLVHEVSEDTGSARALLSREGPLGAFAATELRAASRFGGRVFSAGSAAVASVAPGGTAFLTLDVSTPPPLPSPVEVSALVRTASPDAVQIEFAHAGTTWRQALSASARPVGEAWAFRQVLPASELPSGAGGGWTLRIINDGAEAAERRAAGILVHHGGTSEPFPREGTFESAVLDLGGTARITEAALDAVMNFGTTVVASLRAAPTRDALTSLGWIPVDPTTGMAMSPVLGRYAQVRLELRGPATDTPRVRGVTLRVASCIE